jgi:hypothetical protein
MSFLFQRDDNPLETLEIAGGHPADHRSFQV